MNIKNYVVLVCLLIFTVACEVAPQPANSHKLAAQGANLVKNGAFDKGGEDWSLLANGNKYLSYDDNGIDAYGRYCVWVGNGGDQPYDIYLYQNGLKLNEGSVYTLRLSAMTSVGETAQFRAKVGGGASPHTPYSDTGYQLYGDAAQFKQVSFTASKTDENARLELQLGGSSETQYFCFDNISLTADVTENPEPQPDPGLDPEPQPDPEPDPSNPQQSLRELAEAKGLLIGAALQAGPLADESAYRDAAAREFNMLFPESSFLISEMHTAEDPYTLSNAEGLARLDSIVDFALANDAEVQAFHLVWFLEASWAPWLNDIPSGQRREFIRNRIQDVMARYDGKVNIYNVVNEAFEKDGSLRGQTSQDTENWLYEKNPEEPYGYIEYSFKEARKADAGAKLYYNDYGISFDGPKWDAVLKMVTDLKQRGVPIDGVGFQAHLNMKWGQLPPASELAKHMQQLDELGLEARVTEFDVGIETGGNDAYADTSEAERLAIQAQTYKDYLNVCIEAPNCDAFAMWGFTDKYSWITEEKWGGSPAAKPLPFDANYQPKEAYKALQETLAQ